MLTIKTSFKLSCFLYVVGFYKKNGRLFCQDGNKYPESKWDQEIELCQQSVEVMNRMRPKPAFFVVCGDLVDAFPDQYPDIR